MKILFKRETKMKLQIYTIKHGTLRNNYQDERYESPPLNHIRIQIKDFVHD